MSQDSSQGSSGQQPINTDPNLHWDGTRWLRWNGHEWRPADEAGAAAATPAVPPPPPPATTDAAAPAPAAATPGAAVAPAAASSGNPWRTVAIVLGALVLLAGGIAGGVWFANRGGGSTPTAAPVSGPAIGGDTGTAGADIVAVPINTATDPFTPPAGQDETVVPAAVTKPTLVPGGQVGLYGGTMQKASCDREQLVGFLAANPDKAAAWAGVEGITVEQIGPFVRALTPMLLRTDTIVVNHGFVSGKATSFTSVLQAGTAVLVDDRGTPRARCYCGNPLTPAPTKIAAPVYSGPTWPAWNPVSVVVITSNTTVINDFTVINITTGTPFTRPTGTAGTEDVPGTATPGTSPTTHGGTATAVPTGTVEKLFAIESIQGVSENPTKPSTFGIETAFFVTKIDTYHYNNGGIPPGTISLRSSDGKVYGPWQATGLPGQGGVPNATWTTTPNVELPPGQYTVVDSSPATWSWAPDTGGRGIVAVYGIFTALPGN
jgi:hypothetical protein